MLIITNRKNKIHISHPRCSLVTLLPLRVGRFMVKPVYALRQVERILPTMPVYQNVVPPEQPMIRASSVITVSQFQQAQEGD